MFPSSAYPSASIHNAPVTPLTVDLQPQPLESCSRQLLLWCSVGEGVRHRYLWEVFQDGALHRQLVEVGIEEGDDSLWKGRRAIELHLWVMTRGARSAYGVVPGPPCRGVEMKLNALGRGVSRFVVPRFEAQSNALYRCGRWGKAGGLSRLPRKPHSFVVAGSPPLLQKP